MTFKTNVKITNFFNQFYCYILVDGVTSLLTLVWVRSLITNACLQPLIATNRNVYAAVKAKTTTGVIIDVFHNQTLHLDMQRI